jgi:hypothetical protein
MEQSDQELLRQTLMSIVKRIDTGGSSTEPPVVLVVLGSTNEATIAATAKPDCGIKPLIHRAGAILDLRDSHSPSPALLMSLSTVSWSRTGSASTRGLARCSVIEMLGN